ncbi:MAG: succinate dehydrogenase cytochrome b subunit [Dinghuibacter sp.]|nr:succinate dehydrogenase cytochrome b subunit [Dinghuibacter sp.]
MTWKELFTSSIGKKLTMGLTGLFLVTFLVIHAGINACIFANDGGVMFNKAAHFMGSMVVIRIVEIGLFVGFFIHIIQGLVLTVQNNSKRRVKYAVNKAGQNSKWYSRSMGLLGTLLLIFLILHWWHFWIPSRITHAGLPGGHFVEGVEMHNMYGLMQVTFKELWVVILYVLACASLAFHLIHGFQSAFRTLGMSNKKHLAIVNEFGIAFSVVISIVFALMPVAMYLNWIK